MSGKTNGVCKFSQPKRCLVYMRWGNKLEKGCKDESCAKLHPQLCPKSLDLKCLDQACPHKLHTIKCIRAKHDKVKSAFVKPGAKSVKSGRPVKAGTGLRDGGKSNHCGCRNSHPAHKPTYAQAARRNTSGQGGVSRGCLCKYPLSTVVHGSKESGKAGCQCDNSPATTSQNNQGFPWSTVQQPMLEAYMEKVVKESMEKLVKQLLTANARQA